MTLPRLFAISRRWETVPPLSVTTAAIARSLGAIRDRPAVPVQAANDEDMGDLLYAMGGVQSEMPQWLREAMSQS